MIWRRRRCRPFICSPWRQTVHWLDWFCPFVSPEQLRKGMLNISFVHPKQRHMSKWNRRHQQKANRQSCANSLTSIWWICQLTVTWCSGHECYTFTCTRRGKSTLYDQPTHVNQRSANKQQLVGWLLAVSPSSVGRSSVDCCPLVGRQSVVNQSLVGQQFSHHGWSTWNMVYKNMVFELICFCHEWICNQLTAD